MGHRYRTCRVSAAVALSVICGGAINARAQNYPGWGLVQPYASGFLRQQQTYDRQQAQATQQQDQAARQEAAREHAPHPASVRYSGELTPVTDLKRFISGRTLFLAAPIVADNQVVRMNEMPVYFSAEGRSYSPFWAGQTWVVEGNAFCVGGSDPAHCVRVFQDSEHQVFAMSPQNILQHLTKIESGDTQRFQAASAHIQSAQRGAQPTRPTPNMSEYDASAALAGMLFKQIGKNPSHCYNFVGRYTGNTDKWDDCDPNIAP